MSNDNIFTFDSFLRANPDKKLNSIDYVHAIFELNKLPIDFIFCLMQLISPEFKVVNGAVFLAEQFDLDVYKKYILQGKNERECQKWINLIELTALFDNVESEKIIKLANFIINVWNFKLANEITDGDGMAKVIYDAETEEIFITIV